MRRKFNRSLLGALSLVLALGACGGSADPDSPDGQVEAAPTTNAAEQATDTAGDVAAFPVTINVEGHEITIDAKPERIAALSPDVAEVALALAPDRLVAVPMINTMPSFGSHIEIAAEIPNQVAPGNSPDPEQVISWGPDLVLITERHGGEQDASQLLSEAGIVTVAINDWSSLDAVMTNITLIGAAIGEQDRAAEVVQDMEARIEAVDEALAETNGLPRVVALSDQSSTPFIVGSHNALADILRHAGTTSPAEEMGLEVPGGPADPELLVAMQPDYLVLVDVWGIGDANYKDLLESEALATIPAIEQGNIIIVPASESFGVAHTLVDGLERIAGLIHPEQF